MNIINYYENRFGNVRAFYYSDNSGNPVRGRNKGILESKGDYIAFHDSDDIAEPKRLIYSMKALMKYDADIVYGNWRAIVDKNNSRTDILDKQIVYSSEFNNDKLKQDNFICQSTVMVKKEALIDVGGFNDKMKYREDHELWLRLAYQGYKFKSVNKVLTNLRLHDENLELKFKKDDDYWYNQMLKLYKSKINFDL
jgi:cellulose synthase/poly-beta-1,6-N-acetylglucosamine synthase-like glycosyltransferase